MCSQPGHPKPIEPGFPRETLLSVRQGQPEALAALFEYAFDGLYGLAFRMLGDRSAAEDVIQEVFLRLHRAAGTLDTEKDPLPWLRSITANLCRDHWRTFAHKVSTKSDDVNDTNSPAAALAGREPNPEEQTLVSEKELTVQGAINSLPDQLREIVVLRNYEGLDHGSIATMLGVSPAAVRKRYSRALTQLGDLLKDVWP